MKLLSYLTLSALLTISACSHGPKSCCAKKDAVSCTKDDCQKACCSKDKKCSDGSCTKDEKACAGESCKKKS
jgi:hypothetical protein